MRNTKQKQLILKIIENSHDHLTVNEIYNICKKEIPNISLGTVYRNLNFLVNFDYITKLNFDNDIVRYDKNIDHAHFICIKCNRIIDIFDYSFKCNIKNTKILNYKINIEGICEDCRKKEEINGIKK